MFSIRKNKLYLENKKEYVYAMFEDLARNYDKMNEIISLGKNLDIKERVIKRVEIKPGSKILDVCCGTGDIAIYLARNYDCKVTAIDFSRNMLDLATKKAEGLDNVEFVQADALNLPFENETFDNCFISYGLRNLADLRKGLLEMKRVTKKGGHVINLDLGKSKSIFNGIFRLYFFNIVPLFGMLFHGDFAPYRYLPESNEDFPSQTELVEIFKELGFSEIKNYDFVLGTLAQQIAKV